MIKVVAGLLLPLFLVQSAPTCFAQAVPLGSVGPFGISWSMAQAVIDCNASTLGTGTSQTYGCTATLGSNDTAGNPILVIGAIGAATMQTGSFAYSSYTSSETLTQCPASTSSASFNTGSGKELITCLYVLSAAGGNKTFKVNFTGSVSSSAHAFYGTMVLEGHRSTGTATYDACPSGTSCETSAAGTASRASPGSACMQSGTNDWVVQFLADTETITGASSPYLAINSPFIDNNVAYSGAWGFGLSSASSFNWGVSGETSTDVGVMACASFR